MSIGTRIQIQRKKLKITQPQLAEKLELSLNMIKKLETDRVKPSIETLEKLSLLFKCSSDYLLGLDLKESSEKTEIERMKQQIRDIVSQAKTEEDVKSILFIMQKVMKE